MLISNSEVSGKLHLSGLTYTLMLDETGLHLFIYIDNVLSAQVDLAHAGYYIESASDSATRISIVCKDRDTEFRFEVEDEYAFSTAKLLKKNLPKVLSSELPSTKSMNAEFPVKVGTPLDNVYLRISNEINSHMLVELAGFALIAHLDMFGVNLTPNIPETHTLSFTGNACSQNGASTYAGFTVAGRCHQSLVNHLINHRFVHFMKKNKIPKPAC
ncbi:TPA: hypothetical protein I7730_00715 [Vibrio vulnificus]|uniref:Uncharacterized protein n=1 Tax=Vibrio vulnificus TaxID=672 RepID=A0A8H9MY53_VIBVL|nr:hypothetical protein [Vibrio vulnificus]HAS8538321.1 hypothetical protein [Vibrio vulnificus]